MYAVLRPKSDLTVDSLDFNLQGCFRKNGKGNAKFVFICNPCINIVCYSDNVTK